MGGGNIVLHNEENEQQQIMMRADEPYMVLSLDDIVLEEDEDENNNNNNNNATDNNNNEFKSKYSKNNMNTIKEKVRKLFGNDVVMEEKLIEGSLSATETAVTIGNITRHLVENAGGAAEFMNNGFINASPGLVTEAVAEGVTGSIIVLPTGSAVRAYRKFKSGELKENVGKTVADVSGEVTSKLLCGSTGGLIGAIAGPPGAIVGVIVGQYVGGKLWGLVVKKMGL